ncbi:unnamed protein product [Owenia fusiformis]|uniref:Uncharacterized protein n=1 Tax=Owenia fusiformis TaxID=6347 RepID=A0A8J1TRY3_OWEFU|nr:unnamed protein product [Owenia fusiformis]
MMSTVSEESPRHRTRGMFPTSGLSGEYSPAVESHFLSDTPRTRSKTQVSGPTRSSRKNSESIASSFGVKDFGFEAKTSYDATEHLLKSRSDNYFNKSEDPVDDIWKRQPPDFRPQIFGPYPPKRNTQDSMQPWKYGTFPGKQSSLKQDENDKVELPPVLQIIQKPSREKTRFMTRFHIDDPHEARQITLRNDLLPPGDYVPPQLHDFRQYPPLKKLGLSEFITTSDPDPYNIKFITERLNQIKGLHGRPPTERDTKGRQMAPPLHQPPKWEVKNHHPRGPWPTGSASYTRHRRARNAKSAFMQRVTGTLETQWAKEKLEKELTNHAKSAHPLR